MQNCPVCDRSEWKDRYKIDDWTIVECGECRFARVSPFPERQSRPEFYTEEAHQTRTIQKKRSTMRKLSGSAKRAWKRLTSRDKYRIFYDKLDRHLEKGSKVLDVGCADGAFIEYARKKFICTGIDIGRSESLAKRDFEECDFIIDDFLTADLKGRTYDGVTIIALLEHLDDPLQALNKSAEALNPGGILLLKTVNYESLNRKFMGKKWTGFRPPDHLVYFTPKNLKQMLKKVGFTKVKISAQPFNDNLYCDAWK